tara:strand:+ start:8776 stop:8949 length:174 start_codon:yes stop_codon:yes gene_type:complete
MTTKDIENLNVKELLKIAKDKEIPFPKPIRYMNKEEISDVIIKHINEFQLGVLWDLK